MKGERHRGDCMFHEMYQDRVRHLVSQCRSTDEELTLAGSIHSTAERIHIEENGPEGTVAVTVFTPEAVLHFSHFRNQYEGQASRALVSLLHHFGVVLPLSVLLAHPTMTIDLVEARIDTGETVFPIEARAGLYHVVERVEWDLCASTLDTLYAWAVRWQLSPAHLVELAVSLLAETQANPSAQ